MAELKQGILGPVNGKVGTVVGVMWRGVNYIRAKPRKSSKKPTAKQLLQWDKMSLVSTFTSKFKDFVNAHCPPVFNGEKWMTGKEQMISRIMKHGIVMYNGLQHVKVENTILSIGNLAPAVIKKINGLKTGKLKVQWDNSLINALTLDTDLLTMMVYNEELNEFKAIENVGNRVDKFAHFSLPKEWNKGRIYFWSMWKSEDGSIHSTSCFHGMLEFKEESLEIEKEEVEVAAIQPIEQSIVEHTLRMEHENANAEEQGSLLTPQQTHEVIPPFRYPIAKGKLIPPVHTVAEKPSEEVKIDLALKQPPKEKELKKWTPPGYIRRVNKRVIKEAKQSDNKVCKEQTYEGVLDGARSILEAQNILDQKNE